MSQTPPQPAAPTNPPTTSSWNPDVVFPMIADPIRRRLLLRLAAGTPRAGSQLAPGAGRRLDAVLKHLTALRDAKMLVTFPDPTDKRRTLYGLAPGLVPVQGPHGLELDFGCCELRL